MMLGKVLGCFWDIGCMMLGRFLKQGHRRDFIGLHAEYR